MTDKNDFGQRVEIDGQFAGYLKPTDDGRWEVPTSRWQSSRQV